MTPELHPATQRLLRDLAPQALAVIARRHPDFAAAEDAVQEALLAAAATWSAELPRNPLGWLIHVAGRRLTDHLRAETARRRREEAAALAPAPPPAPDTPPADDSLDLVFMCCHPALTPPSAIALTLRALGGLTTAEIARAFHVPEATMAQRISRAKRTLRDADARFEPPTPETRADRLVPVRHTLYLIFNEGYAAAATPCRADLCAEAIRLTRLLHTHADDPETTGLLALMLLTDARRPARSPCGDLVPLDEQDRTRWDHAAIREGTALLERALPRGHIGPYQIQAAIAALHDEAPTADATDWPQILALYRLLRRVHDTPMAALAEAIALAMTHGVPAGLAALDALPDSVPPHRLDAARGHLLERHGDHRAAIEHLTRAAHRTPSAAERDYLLARIAALNSPESPADAPTTGSP